MREITIHTDFYPEVVHIDWDEECGLSFQHFLEVELWKLFDLEPVSRRPKVGPDGLNYYPFWQYGFDTAVRWDLEAGEVWVLSI